MKTAAILFAAACLLGAPGAVLAQPAPAKGPAPAAVTPQQIDAAEKALIARARASFRTSTRTPALRAAALTAAGAGGATLGATTTVSPRAPYAADKAWLNTTLGVSDVFDGSVIVMAYPDEFAPQGAIDVIIKATAGRRYLVECTALTVGAPATRASIFAGASPYAATTPVKDATIASGTPGAVVSVLTPAATTPFLRVSLDVPRGAIAANGQAVLVTDKCEVTPVS